MIAYKNWGLMLDLYAQKQCTYNCLNQTVIVASFSGSCVWANSHCSIVVPSQSLLFCMQTYIQNTMAIVKRITMMRATAAPTAIPIMWFVLRPTDGGDGKKDAMGEDVVR